MRAVRWLAVLPFPAMLVGPFFLNRVSPLFSACLSAGLACGGGQQDPRAIMAVIFWLDPQNRDGAP